MALTMVYKSKASCVAALQAVEQLRPTWWTGECSEFVRRAESLQLNTLPAGCPSKVLILIEGLDGVGKTTTVTKLSKRLQGVMVRSPDPSLESIRELFREQEPSTSRAFYTAANYLAAWKALYETGDTRFVILDRWWSSTCAMALANAYGSVSELPPAGDKVYEWPQDLPPVTYGALLYLDEAVRVERIRRRAPEFAEEKRLAEWPEMREIAMTVYRRLGVFEDVPAETYGVAVNAILAGMTARGIEHDAVPFTAEELAQMKPL